MTCGRKPLKFLGGIHSDCYDIFILLLIVIWVNTVVSHSCVSGNLYKFTFKYVFMSGLHSHSSTVSHVIMSAKPLPALWILAWYEEAPWPFMLPRLLSRLLWTHTQWSWLCLTSACSFLNIANFNIWHAESSPLMQIYCLSVPFVRYWYFDRFCQLLFLKS